MSLDIFKEIEKYVKKHDILKNKSGIIDGEGNTVDSIFTDSEEMDIHEMLSDGYSKEEIIEIMKTW